MVIGSELSEKYIFEVCLVIRHVEKNIFLKNQKKVNFFKSDGVRTAAGYFELFQTGRRPVWILEMVCLKK